HAGSPRFTLPRHGRIRKCYAKIRPSPANSAGAAGGGQGGNGAPGASGLLGGLSGGGFRCGFGRWRRGGVPSGGGVKRALLRGVRVGGHRMIAPEPPQHFGKHGAAHMLTVAVDAPDVVHVVPLFDEGVLEPHVLEEPVHARVVGPVAALSAVVVPPPVQEDAQG